MGEAGGALYSEPVGANVPAVAREIGRAKAARDAIMFVCDSHLANDPEFTLFPPTRRPAKAARSWPRSTRAVPRR